MRLSAAGRLIKSWNSPFRGKLTNLLKVPTRMLRHEVRLRECAWVVRIRNNMIIARPDVARQGRHIRPAHDGHPERFYAVI